MASVAYRYRKWDLGNGINLVIRSEIDAVSNGPNGEILYLNVKALNEWDSKVSFDEYFFDGYIITVKIWRSFFKPDLPFIS